MREVKIYRGIAKLKEVDLFYFDTRTEKPVILCLHGMAGRAETWADFIEKYGKEYRIIAPDQRGHGLSSKPIAKYTYREMAEDAVELLDFLKIDSAIVVGHSMGGAIAANLAALYPSRVKAVAILDKSAADPEKPNLLPLDQISQNDPITKDWPMPFATLHEAKECIKQATESDLEYQYFMNSLIESVEGYRMMFSPQAMAAYIAYKESWFHLLPKIKCLAMLMRTSSHEAIPDEDFAKMQSLLSNCISCEMSHPDHNVHLGNQEEFYQYFDEFLRKVVQYTV